MVHHECGLTINLMVRDGQLYLQDGHAEEMVGHADKVPCWGNHIQDQSQGCWQWFSDSVGAHSANSALVTSACLSVRSEGQGEVSTPSLEIDHHEHTALWVTCTETLIHLGKLAPCPTGSATNSTTNFCIPELNLMFTG